jgi:hypothetical protein
MVFNPPMANQAAIKFNFLAPRRQDRQGNPFKRAPVFRFFLAIFASLRDTPSFFFPRAKAAKSAKKMTRTRIPLNLCDLCVFARNRIHYYHPRSSAVPSRSIYGGHSPPYAIRSGKELSAGFGSDSEPSSFVLHPPCSENCKSPEENELDHPQIAQISQMPKERICVNRRNLRTRYSELWPKATMDTVYPMGIVTSNPRIPGTADKRR